MSIYGLIIGIATILGLELLRRKTNIKEYHLLLLPIFALIGARTLFLLHNIEEIVRGEIKIFHIWNGGLAFWGALIGLLFGIYILSRKYKTPFLSLTDTSLLFLPLLQAIGRIGNYFNRELYGKPTDLPWAIEIPKEFRLEGYENFLTFHPLFLYEAVLNIFLFTLLLYISKKSKMKGVVTTIYLIGYSLIRIWMNRIRIDKEYFLGIETSDLFASVFLIIGILLLVVIYKKHK